MARQRITDRTLIKDHAVSGDRLEIWDDLLPGFGLRITARGVKSFFVFTRLQGSGVVGAPSCVGSQARDCVVVTGRQVTIGGSTATTFAGMPYGSYYPNTDMGGRFYSEPAARLALVFAMQDLAVQHYPAQVANNQMIPELSAKVRKYHNGKYGWSMFRIGCMNCNGVAGQVKIGFDDLTVSVVHMHWNGSMMPSFDPATNTGDIPEMFNARQQLFALKFLAGVGPGPNICAYVGGYGGQLSPCY